MRFAKSTADFLMVVLALHWAWMVTEEGYARWGILGGIFSLMASAPLLPLSPFVAWLFPVQTQVLVFYALVAAIAICLGIYALTRPRITSDYPYR